MSPNLNILQITSSTFTLLAVMLNVLGQFLALFFTDKNTQQTLQLVLFDFNCGIFEYVCVLCVISIRQNGLWYPPMPVLAWLSLAWPGQ